MKIAQIAPLVESVPPALYGGTERIVSYLTEELVWLGHDVTLFASAESKTTARLIPCSPRALRHDSAVGDPLAHYTLMLERVRSMAEEFDLLHFHIDFLHFPLFRPIAGRTVTTLHGRQDMPGLKSLYSEFDDMPLVSISHAQRLPIAGANFIGTVYHGLPPSLYELCERPGEYLAFLGRMSPEKGPDRAIQIARAAGIPLRMAAKVDKADADYFSQHIRPMLSPPEVEFVGEINEGQKRTFLGEARALLFPIDWPEPFGLVMVEAMACGTPVLAFDRGSVREIIDDGMTGRIVRTIEEAIDALPEVMALDRMAIRRRFEERSSVRRMARDYVNIYRTLLRKRDNSSSSERDPDLEASEISSRAPLIEFPPSPLRAGSQRSHVD